MQSTRFDVHQCVRQKNPCRMYVNFDDKLSASLFVCLYSESAQPMRSDMHAISNVLALFPIFLHCCCIQLSLQVVVDNIEVVKPDCEAGERTLQRSSFLFLCYYHDLRSNAPVQ